jgi:ubiquinol-cytochrome c reductase iron-sulfur subunit
VQEHPDEQERIAGLVESGGSKLTRRRLFKLSLGAVGGALGVALVVPAASLGPVLDIDSFYDTPWKKGRRLVDEAGKPWRAADIQINDFFTAFPEGGDKEALGSPVVVVRLKPGQFESHRSFAAEGIVALSKICTHAGCAISLYRAPLFQPDEPKPALVCPCHYSTFDPANGGVVTFGPAGRKLPMLPLEIDAGGGLRAASTFDEPIGPSWWGVQMRKPIPPS